MKHAEVTELATEVNTSTRITGTIIHVDYEKGYGFINSKHKPFTRIFFHWQALDHRVQFETIGKGDKVSFELRHNDNGFRAIKIELI